MRNILQAYTPESNFWKENSQFTMVQPFKKLYKSDRTKGKIYSSTLMWSIALMYHPKSDMYHLDNKEENILTNILGLKEKEIDEFFEKNTVYIDVFKDIALTQPEKSLVSWENRLKDRDQFLSEQQYTFGYSKEEDGVVFDFKDNTKQLDDMASKTAKLYEEYFKIRKELLEEESLSRNKRINSATADGEI